MNYSEILRENMNLKKENQKLKEILAEYKSEVEKKRLEIYNLILEKWG